MLPTSLRAHARPDVPERRAQRDRNPAGAACGVAGPKLVRPGAGLNFSEFSPPAHGELPRMHVLSA